MTPSRHEVGRNPAAQQSLPYRAVPFTSINISDADSELLATAEERLSALGAPVQATAGPASLAMPKMVKP